MARKYRTLLCGEPAPCPNDDEFVHDNYFGCVPKDFSPGIGRSKTHRQSNVAMPGTPLGYLWLWDGGCDAKNAVAAPADCETGEQ